MRDELRLQMKTPNTLTLAVTSRAPTQSIHTLSQLPLICVEVQSQIYQNLC